MKILIYEDEKFKDLYPLNMLRAVYDIRCGANTIKERIEHILGNKFEVSLHCRKILEAYMKEIHSSPLNVLTKHDHLFLNGRVIFTDASLKSLISNKNNNSFFTFNNEIVAAYISKDQIESFKDKILSEKDGVIDQVFFKESGLKEIKLKKDFDVFIINFPWDAVSYTLNGGLTDDMEYILNKRKKFAALRKSDNLINRKKIFISKSSELSSDVSIDATNGEVLISDNVIIEPFTFIKGPVYIGKNSYIKSGTKIYGPCVIGENSKVAGEIAESIFHSYVNKQHDGFIGHSYVCPFVNLGADTVTSDLKNNYSEIRIRQNDIDIDTQMRFLGSIIGDHSKTSINTMLNTGSIIGIFSNIFGGGFPPKVIDSFSWNEAGKPSAAYDVNKAIETAKIVMERRGIKMSKAYEELVRSNS